MIELLTNRENEVVAEISKGYTVKEAATRLFISPSTVDTHIKKSKKKSGARTLAHLSAMFVLSLENPKGFYKIMIVILFVFAQCLILMPRKINVEQRQRKTVRVSRSMTNRARYQITA
ncbi:response regulator transcription factor [Changchengzhania lutea]|uniref:response regulator transcription factor n=1 Tax=Changchengzhania lutea TaxID=2049305 RepID=UPI00115D653A|nr:helix-turn-helix transcriptional regulator [Changchengzhania lutea]